MLLCLGLACLSTTNFDPAPDYAIDRTVQYDRRSVRACAVIADDSPTFPSRLVFLHRTDQSSVDAQAELYGFSGGAGSASGGDASKFRCGEVALHLVPGRDGTPVYMDFMPPTDTVTIRELRVYRFDTTWNPNDPFATAIEGHEPFRDYFFRANLSAPYSFDPGTLYVGTP